MAGIEAEAMVAAAEPAEQAAQAPEPLEPMTEPLEPITEPLEPAPAPTPRAHRARYGLTGVVQFTAVLVAAYGNRFLTGVTTRAIGAVRTTPGCEKLLLLWNKPRAELDAALRDAWPPMTLEAVQAQAGAPLRVLFESVNSLNNRYRHLEEIETEAVVFFDDDVKASMVPELLLGVLQPWAHERTRLVSTCARAIAQPGSKLSKKVWAYQDIHAASYTRGNMMLPHVMAFDKGLLELYMSERYAPLRRWVDEDAAHCDDILLNFVYQSERSAGALWPYAPEWFMIVHDDKGISTQTGRMALRARCAEYIATHLPQPASGAPKPAWLRPATRLWTNWSHVVTRQMERRGRDVLYRFKQESAHFPLNLLPALRATAPAVPVLPFGKETTVALLCADVGAPAVSRAGEGGPSARMVGRVFQQHPETGIKLVYVLACGAERTDGKGRLAGETAVHGWPLVNLCSYSEGATSGTVSTAWAKAYLRERKVRLFIFVDYRLEYMPAAESMPDVPIILWAREPRTQAQRHRIEHVALPGEAQPAQGTRTADARGARELWARAARVGVGMAYEPAMYNRVPEAYNLPRDAIRRELPDVVGTCTVHGLALQPKPAGMEAPTPEVLFLARPDPVTRPWLLVELARAFPEVTFYALGKPRSSGPGWFEPPPAGAVPNLVFLGAPTSEMEKAERLARAWFVVNLSVHESVPTAWLEAFHCRTPVLGTVNPGGLVRLYGRYAGEWKGNGLAGLPRIKAAFLQLLTNHTLRAELGVAARKHVLETHNTPRFVRKFVELSYLVAGGELNRSWSHHGGDHGGGAHGAGGGSGGGGASSSGIRSGGSGAHPSKRPPSLSGGWARKPASKQSSMIALLKLHAQREKLAARHRGALSSTTRRAAAGLAGRPAGGRAQSQQQRQRQQ